MHREAATRENMVELCGLWNYMVNYADKYGLTITSRPPKNLYVDFRQKMFEFDLIQRRSDVSFADF